MSKLFDMYLISLLKERIPMPAKWQGTMGLKLENGVQSAVEIANNSEKTEKLSGYIFDRDEPLQRGFISKKILSTDVTTREKHMIQVYLQAIKEHTGEDYTNYFNYSITTQQPDTLYHTTIPVIEGEKYTIVGNSLLPATWEYYTELENEVFAQGELKSLSVPYTIDTADYLEETKDYHGQQEYFMIKVITQSPTHIIRGTIKSLASINQFEDLKEANIYRREQVSGTIPKVINNTLYSDKLIPSLLGINIPPDAPQRVKDTITPYLIGNTLQEGIRNATTSIYDRDGNLGRDFLW